jgi:HEAT repeat protein
VDSERVKESVLNALSRIGGKENEDFLMSIVRNQEEPPSMRSSALGRLSRSSTISVNDLSKLYDIADTRSMREQVIGALSNRKENDATDKLIDIAKTSTDLNARKLAISVLVRRNDPRAQAAIRELVEK